MMPFIKYLINISFSNIFFYNVDENMPKANFFIYYILYKYMINQIKNLLHLYK